MYLNFYDTDQSTVSHPIVIQDVEIYKDQYLSPNSFVSYDSSLDAITINGINTDLSAISSGVNNKAIFSYDPTTNTAVTNKSITLNPGSSLVLKNGKLLMNCASDGSLKINYYTDTGIYLENSILSTTGQSHFLFNQMTDGESTLKNQFSVINSSINNFGNLYLERPTILNIQNSVLSNMVGTTPMQAYFRWSPRQLTLINSTFSGKTGKEKIILCGGDQFRELSPKPVGMDIVDCDFSQIAIECIPDIPYHLSPKYPECTVNLINTKIGQFSGNTSRQKYYLDVKVLDSNGNPLPGAEVKVKNEIDDLNHPAENLLRGEKYYQLSGQLSSSGDSYFEGQDVNWIKGLTDINDHRTAITGVNGHTPKPSDNLNTLVVTASESSNSKKSNYAYTVTASKDGYTSTLSNINVNSTWLRSNPEDYQNTILLTLNKNSSSVNNADNLTKTKENVSNSSSQVTPGQTKNSSSVNNTGNLMKTKVNVLSSSSQVTPGQTFTIDVFIDPSKPITGAQSRILFQGPIVNVNRISEGNLFSQTGTKTYFNNGKVYGSSGLNRYIYCSALGNSSVFSPGTLATIYLTAGRRTGVAKFNLSNVVISDSASNSIPYVTKDASVLIDTAPVLGLIGPKSVYETKTLNFKVNASDADGNLLTFSVSGLPKGASFNKTTRVFTWIPSKGQAGSYKVTFKVSDGYLSDSEDVKITVKKLNNAPVILSHLQMGRL